MNTTTITERNADQNGNSPPGRGRGMAPGSWCQVPKVLVDHWAARLPARAVVVYLILCRHADPDGQCYPGQARIAELAGISARNVRRALEALKTAGLVEFDRKRSGNHYTLLPATPEDTGQNCPLTMGGSGQNRPVTPDKIVRSHRTKSSYRTRSIEQDPQTSAQHFDAWWQQYPRRVAKIAAEKAYRLSLAAVCKNKRLDQAGAVAFLQSRVRTFAASDKGRGDPQYIPHPATWLNQGRYDDEDQAWTASGGNGKPNGPIQTSFSQEGGGA